MTALSRLAAPLALVLLAAPAAAQSIRCIDKEGKTIYMERPCATYGYRTEKEIRNPPKGDGTASPLRPGQALIGSTDQRSGSGSRQQIQLFCDGKQILCSRGDTVVCGTQRKLCEGD
jgi:hypothetical protein